jgi:hypothetical protein
MGRDTLVRRRDVAVRAVTPTPTSTPIPAPTHLPSSSQDDWQPYFRSGGGHYLDNHHYNRAIGGGDTATWEFSAPGSGSYDCFQMKTGLHHLQARLC